MTRLGKLITKRVLHSSYRAFQASPDFDCRLQAVSSRLAAVALRTTPLPSVSLMRRKAANA
jgi:hypothetical protein